MLVFREGTVENCEIRPLNSDEVGFVCLLNPDEAQLRTLLTETFPTHPLVLEDCLHMNQRPKIDVYKDHAFLPFFALGPKGELIELAIILGHNYLLCLTNKEIPFLESIWEDFERSPGHMRDPALVLYQLLDNCAHGYLAYVDAFEDSVTKMENAVVQNPYAKISHNVFRLKRRLHKFRRVFSEEREVLMKLRHVDFPFTNRETATYLNEVYDHLSRAIEEVDTFRDTMTGLIDLQMNLKGDRMNEIMKTLTVVSTIFLPATFIVGLYGINVKGVPEYSWSWGYYWVWGWILVSTIGMWIYFKLKKWF